MKPNILFILVDSFTAEKFFGPKKTSITPTLDNLIKNGTYFTHAIGISPTTVPTVSSLFTGFYPATSVIKKGKFFTINENVENYIEKLRKHGYDTHALIPKILSLAKLDSLFKENIEEFDSFATLYDGVGEQILKKLNFSPIFLKQNLDEAAQLIQKDRKHLDNNPKIVSDGDIVELLEKINNENVFVH